DLVNAPEFDPRLPRPEGLLARLKRMAGGGEPFHVTASRMAPEGLRAVVIDNVQRRLSVTQVGVPYVIGISFASPDPPLAAGGAGPSTSPRRGWRPRGCALRASTTCSAAWRSLRSASPT